MAPYHSISVAVHAHVQYNPVQVMCMTVNVSCITVHRVPPTHRARGPGAGPRSRRAVRRDVHAPALPRPGGWSLAWTHTEIYRCTADGPTHRRGDAGLQTTFVPNSTKLSSITAFVVHFSSCAVRKPKNIIQLPILACHLSHEEPRATVGIFFIDRDGRDRPSLEDAAPLLLRNICAFGKVVPRVLVSTIRFTTQHLVRISIR